MGAEGFEPPDSRVMSSVLTAELCARETLSEEVVGIFQVLIGRIIVQIFFRRVERF